MFNEKKVLITGGNGLIGTELVGLIIEKYPGCDVVIADIKNGNDLRCFNTCLELCKGVDYVFHLMGVKGSPSMTKTKPVDFMAPMLQCDTNMIVAAQKVGVKGFLYTSSIALLNLHTDHFPGTAKQTAETLIDAMRVQYPKGTKYCVVRPSSVYGRFENFDRDGLMFVSQMIKDALNGKDIKLWNDGKSLRDFINAKDVARAMIQTMEDMPKKWRPIGSGKAEPLQKVAWIIAKETGVKLKLGPPGEIDSRLMTLDWDFKPEISLEKGIKEVIKWKRSQS